MGEIYSCDLVPGAIYFALFFVDDGLRVPDIQTLRFQESRDRPDGSREFWFEDLSLDGEGESLFFLEVEPGDLSAIVYDRSGLINVLAQLDI